MKKRLLWLAIPLVLMLGAGFYFRSLLMALLLQSEPIGQEEIKTMLNCRFSPRQNMPLNIDGELFLIPLPDHTADYRPNTEAWKVTNDYLTETGDIQTYITEDLPKAGWTLKDQMGALYVLQNKKDGTEFELNIVKFTRAYYKLSFRDAD